MCLIVTGGFFQEAFWFDEPAIPIKNNWITNNYGFIVFNSSNPFDRWIYIDAGIKRLVKVTPEMFKDKKAMISII